uniref:Zgc:152830 n=1 Tax=Cyprinus carpio TaxID=7962 RepID=A0A8C1GGM8_CYPCA
FYISIQPIYFSCSNSIIIFYFDGIILICQSHEQLPDELECLKAPLQDYSTVDCCIGEEVVVVKVPGLPGNRVVFACTGPVNRDYDDVRRFSDAAANGIKRAMKAGMQRPLLVCPPHSSYAKNTLVAVLGALHVLYTVRNIFFFFFVIYIFTFHFISFNHQNDILDENREACDCPIDISKLHCQGPEKYRQNTPSAISDSPVTVVSNLNTLEKEYPCLAAVNRCANTVPRHQARVIKLLYCGEGPIQQTLLVVGKGITYDTGGADIKAGGIMAGMHRDKCGSAAVAGFFQILAKLKPKHLKVVGAMAMVRNSVGSDCYVADELVVSRAGRRIRVGNTDAEGRMVMVDLLCEMKEQALQEVSPHLFTIATLTGHAIRAMGPHYSIIMDNGAAQRSGNALQWQKAGEMLGDLFEVSTIRREDYEFHKGKSEYEEILQSNNLPSSATPRGHQTPAAFLIMASGLDKHGVDSDKPLPYSHIDIAGSSGPFPGVPTGAPILAMATKYLEL